MGCPEKATAPQSLGGELTPSTLSGRLMSFEAMKAAASGSEVAVAGKIGKVCPAGCWFYLHDASDLVYVSVQGDFSVPQDASGKDAQVLARTEGEGGARTLSATQVVILP